MHISLSCLLYKNIPRKNCYFKKLYIPFSRWKYSQPNS